MVILYLGRSLSHEHGHGSHGLLLLVGGKGQALRGRGMAERSQGEARGLAWEEAMVAPGGRRRRRGPAMDAPRRRRERRDGKLLNRHGFGKSNIERHRERRGLPRGGDGICQDAMN